MNQMVLKLIPQNGVKAKQFNLIGVGFVLGMGETVRAEILGMRTLPISRFLSKESKFSNKRRRRGFDENDNVDVFCGAGLKAVIFRNLEHRSSTDNAIIVRKISECRTKFVQFDHE